MGAVHFEDIHFSWPDGSPLARGFDLEAEAGRVTALLGPSGCGKSTLLRLAAGLLEPSSGQIRTPEGGRAFVFQQPTLLPWRSLRENVRLPLELGGTAGLEVDTALAQVELAEHADKLPGQLSGGQQMRASLARALVTSPSLLLMDEPFAALDALTRRRLQRAFLALHAGSGRTVLLVTHDVDEAVLLADRVVVLEGPPLRPRLSLEVALARPRSVHDPAVGRLVAQIEAAL